VKERHQSWDYGLSMDLELLCLHRKSRLPFRFHEQTWERLEVRKQMFREEHIKEVRQDMDLEWSVNNMQRL